jgi:rubredoxin
MTLRERFRRLVDNVDGRSAAEPWNPAPVEWESGTCRLGKVIFFMIHKIREHLQVFEKT